MTNVIEVHDADFEKEVIDRSFEAPVVVDFWADWCAPCRSLGPILEKLADEGEGAWTLAKLDVDSNPAAANAFGIQGIPAVKAFKDGKLVAEFTGALPEPQVRSWLTQLAPSGADLAMEEGRRAEDAGDRAGAVAFYRKALEADPGRRDAAMKLAALELAARAEGLDRDEMERRLETDPADVDAVIALADLDAGSGDFERAFERLLKVIEVSDGDVRERARQHLIDLMSILPSNDRRALGARRSLSRVLF